MDLRPTCHIDTYGCQMNENDSEILLAYLEELGYTWTDNVAEADAVMVNTCCVRESAEDRAYGRLGELKSLKAQRPELFIGVAGCMTQQPGVAEDMARRFPHVNLILGTHNLRRFPELFSASRTASRPVVDIEAEPEEMPLFPRGVRQGGVTAWVTILRGCDKRCTYCIVPYVRGREMSRPVEEIVAEVEALVRDGVREVTLLGQNVNAYGKDLPGGSINFATLLFALDAVDGLERIRYTTSHPRDFTQEMVEAIAQTQKVCEHFHVPVQSGANHMLRRMARGYTRERYVDLIERIRRAVPTAAITTDLIVGFPGETEEDFEATLDLCEQLRFDKSYTFMYSPRRGTPAADFPEQIPLALKKERLARLIAVTDRLSRDANQRQIGTEVEVLVEGVSKKSEVRLMGRTRHNQPVVFAGDAAWAGQIRRVLVARANTWTLEGEVL
ncbi:MAG: tRNA (N6-isopentenyl adenosine(37)-C2)-methylthiotransferase MiaB [Thermaerobacter sp.]|nr:tRNA (N6-isopentenyl adenosine(37)-C2)-methylthiotransferase MiaB [Thermaerobacter sp.]